MKMNWKAGRCWDIRRTYIPWTLANYPEYLTLPPSTWSFMDAITGLTPWIH